MNRHKANKQLLRVLDTLIDRYPDWRFGQILRNAGFIKEDKDPVQLTGGWADEFYVESFDLLRRVEDEAKTLLNGVERAKIRNECRENEEEKTDVQ